MKEFLTPRVSNCNVSEKYFPMLVESPFGKNFSETVQLEDLAVKNFLLFYHVQIFLKKILNLNKMHF